MNILDRHACDHAEVGGPSGGVLGVGLNFLADLMKIDLLLPKFQRLAAVAEGFNLHAASAFIELASGLDVQHG